MSLSRWIACLALAAGIGASAVACGGPTTGAFDGGTAPVDATMHPVDSGLHLGVDGGDGGKASLTIQPMNPTLNVTGKGATLAFKAYLSGSPVSAKWSLDAAGIGTIDGSGLFHASGLSGGSVHVTATAAGLNATTTLLVHLKLTENPGALSPSTKTSLLGGGKTDAGFKWLYPYDATVWPNDLPAPTLQFGAGTGAGAGFDAALVHVTFAGLDYEGFYGPGALPSQIPLSKLAWAAITTSASGSDTVKVAVTKISGGLVTGPITEDWTIASGGLRGSIFYNSYNSTLAGSTGAILKLRPAEQLLSVVVSTNGGTTCHVCHAVAANGSILEASSESSSSTADSVWSLVADGGTAAPQYNAPDRTWDFGAFTPDGKKFLRYGAVPWTSGAWAPDVRGLGNPTTDVPTDLFDPKTGVSLGPKGLDVGPGGAPINMMMPAFSPDGKFVVFNHYDTGLGHTVALMSFDDATNTFSKLHDVATLPSTLYAGWPTFTPDDRYVLFAGGTNAEYDTLSDNTAVTPEPTSNIYLAHVASATIATADALNGVAGGKTYLPFPDDPNLNFEPAILPVASGGYYWVVFTTRRNYGNTINGDPYAGAGGVPSPRKKLWVAAISIPPSSGAGTPTKAADTTHPAFYLDGQELGPGNMRAFWALDPCTQNGTSCATGYQCCSGFCRQTTGSDGGVAFSCVAPPTGCSNANEKCTTSADCCEEAAGYECINGFCAQPSPR